MQYVIASIPYSGTSTTKHITGLLGHTGLHFRHMSIDAWKWLHTDEWDWGYLVKFIIPGRDPRDVYISTHYRHEGLREVLGPPRLGSPTTFKRRHPTHPLDIMEEGYTRLRLLQEKEDCIVMPIEPKPTAAFWPKFVEFLDVDPSALDQPEVQEFIQEWPKLHENLKPPTTPEPPLPDWLPAVQAEYGFSG